MSEPETFPTDVHPEAALLPWFVNDTLREADRQLVAHHLETCSSCRSELIELTEIRRRLATVYAVEPEPSPRITQSVLHRIAQEASSLPKMTSRGHWLDRLDNWIRSLLVVRWAPTLSAFVLLAQFGVLFWATLPATQPEQVTSRSLPSQTVKFNVTFQETATEAHIRSVLNTVRGRVIDGPTPRGTYVIEVLAADEETTRKKLEILRDRTDVIRSADAEKP